MNANRVMISHRMEFYFIILGISFSSILVMHAISVAYASTSAVNGSGVTTNTTIMESEGIAPYNVRTEPADVKVGDRFNILASIVNYSPNTVKIPDGGCSPTGLMATFDEKVTVEQGAQFPICYQTTLTPAKTIASHAGWPSENYTAISPGLTNATLHLTYYIIDDDNQTQMKKYDKDFQFFIQPNPMDINSVQAFLQSVQTGCEGGPEDLERCKLK